FCISCFILFLLVVYSNKEPGNSVKFWFVILSLSLGPGPSLLLPPTYKCHCLEDVWLR
ncbi:unnamed protein product, partial [Larinioides sclopetarius]